MLMEAFRFAFGVQRLLSCGVHWVATTCMNTDEPESELWLTAILQAVRCTRVRPA